MFKRYTPVQEKNIKHADYMIQYNALDGICRKRL